MHYLVTFNHVSKSGKKKNYSLFENETDSKDFLIQLVQCANIEVVSYQKVNLTIFHDFNLCEILHSNDGAFEHANVTR